MTKTEAPSRLRRSDLESARNNLTVGTPLDRARDRGSLDVPATAGVPEGAHSPERAVLIADVEDVRPAVNQQSAGLSLTLLLQQFPELAEGGLFVVRADVVADRPVDRVLLQLVDVEDRRSDILLRLAVEIDLEVAADPVDLHAVDGLAFAELVACDELVNADDVNSSDELEKRRFRRCDGKRC